MPGSVWTAATMDRSLWSSEDIPSSCGFSPCHFMTLKCIMTLVFIINIDQAVTPFSVCFLKLPLCISDNLNKIKLPSPAILQDSSLSEKQASTFHCTPNWIRRLISSSLHTSKTEGKWDKIFNNHFPGNEFIWEISGYFSAEGFF